MSEPLIIGYGRQFVHDYTVQEYRDSLSRAFRNNRADFVVLDDNPRGQKFLAACAAWAIDAGLLFVDCSETDGEQTVSSFRLTKQGEKEILGQS